MKINIILRCCEINILVYYMLIECMEASLSKYHKVKSLILIKFNTNKHLPESCVKRAAFASFRVANGSRPSITCDEKKVRLEQTSEGDGNPSFSN